MGSVQPAAPTVPAPVSAPASTSTGVIDARGMLIIAGVVLVLLVVITLVSTGSLLATLVVIAILVGVVLILNKLGYLHIDLQKGTLSVEFHEITPAAPAPSDKTSGSAPMPIEQKEVFHIGNNDYTYEDAPAVCAAYGAEIATYDQVNQAYTLGAEWCSYGWSQGAMALYPTQEKTWLALQAEPTKKTNCGRPGVNGGYFDPATKFGVNCYGIKPQDSGTTFPQPPPGSDNASFTQAVQKFKSMLNSIPVNPFNRAAWSEWNLSAHT